MGIHTCSRRVMRGRVPAAPPPAQRPAPRTLTVGQFQLRIQMWSARNDVVRRSPTSNGQNHTNSTTKIAR